MPTLVAEVAFTYAAKSLKAGDEFEATEKDANILNLTKRARYSDKTSDSGKLAAGNSVHSEDIDVLRSKYRSMRGQDPDMRWGVGRLQKEITSPGTYGRRDMRAED